MNKPGMRKDDPDATLSSCSKVRGMTHPANIDVIITTKDEEANLPYALESLAGWINRVFVVDSGSTDRTCQIAAEWGATVLHQDWLGYARQKNWALDNLPLESDWVFILDADEAIMPDLKAQMIEVAGKPVDRVPEAGFHVNRFFIFLGKRIRHCGYYPSWNIRFFRRGKAHYEEREVHEQMVVDGPTRYLSGHMSHNDRRGLEHYMAKHNRYSTLEAREIVKLKRHEAANQVKPRFFGDRAERRRWLKQVIYPKLPAKWLARFIYMYVWRLGALDGLTGLRFCLFISAYELLVSLKIVEIERAEREPPPTANNL